MKVTLKIGPWKPGDHVGDEERICRAPYVVIARIEPNSGVTPAGKLVQLPGFAWTVYQIRTSRARRGVAETAELARRAADQKLREIYGGGEP